MTTLPPPLTIEPSAPTTACLVSARRARHSWWEFLLTQWVEKASVKVPGKAAPLREEALLEILKRVLEFRALFETRTLLKVTMEDVKLPRVGIVPVTEDAATLYEMWVGWGGEGIVLKDRGSICRPGVRSPAWLKLKPKITLEVVVTGGSATPISWGDWGLAVMLEFRYTPSSPRLTRGDSPSRSRSA